MVSAEVTTVRLCEHCGRSLVPHEGESPAQFVRRRFCDKKCVNAWRQGRKLGPRRRLPSIRLNRQLRAGPRNLLPPSPAPADGHRHVWLMEPAQRPSDDGEQVGWHGRCAICGDTRFDEAPEW